MLATSFVETGEALDGAMVFAEADALGSSSGRVLRNDRGLRVAAGATLLVWASKPWPMSPLEAEAFSAKAHRVLGRLESLAMPTIAAINGFALGGGCELALACDFAFAAREAKLGQPETKLGLIPGFGGTSRLVRRVGLAWAKQLVLVGDPIDAEEALRIGLVNRVYPAEELIPAALAAAAAAASRGPVATRIAKQVMQEGQDADVRMAHALEIRAFGLVFATQDRVEGTTAFVEKREAKFAGN